MTALLIWIATVIASYVIGNYYYTRQDRILQEQLQRRERQQYIYK